MTKENVVPIVSDNASNFEIIEAIKQLQRLILPALNLGSEGNIGDITVTWNDVDNKPTVFTSDWEAVANKPELFASSWELVNNKPTEFASTWALVSGKPTEFASTWTLVANKPTEFPPSAHGHVAGEISGLATVATSGNYIDLQNKPELNLPIEWTQQILSEDLIIPDQVGARSFSDLLEISTGTVITVGVGSTWTISELGV